MTGAHRKEIVEAAARGGLPAIYQVSEFVDLGGPMSYGLNMLRQYRRNAVYVDKILRGAKPGDLPVEQPTAFELVVNMRTAKALGITIPRSILLRAERVIE
jgi:putative ABC transport system substrate-binding protein